jgi:RHS repeat-associated protein
MKPLAAEPQNRAESIQKISKLSRRSWFLVLGIGLVLGLMSRLDAQTYTNDYLDRINLPDFGVAQPVEMGFANLANGTLHLDIPFASIPQRGGKSVLVKLTYDSRIYGRLFNPSPFWYPANVIGSDGGWKVIVTGAQADRILNSNGCQPLTGGSCLGKNYAVSQGTCDLGGGMTGNIQYFQNFTWSSVDGDSKLFYITTAAADCPAFDQPNGSAYATDGSGFEMVVTNYNEAVVYDRSGNQVYSDLIWPNTEDSNGNIVGRDSNGNLVDQLGRTLVIKTINGNTTYYDVLNSQGSRSRYTVTYTTINVSTAFGRSDTTEYSGTLTTVQSLTLPNGTSYTFGYDSGTDPGNYGLLTNMTLPTGAQIQYGYTTITDAHCDTNRWLNSRNSAGNSWGYVQAVTQQAVQCPGFDNTDTGGQQVTVNRPNGESVVYVFSVPENSGAWNTSVTYQDSSTQTVESELKEYTPAIGTYLTLFDGRLPSKRTISLPITGGSLSKKTEYSYDNINYGNVSEVREWDWYSGTPPSTPTRVTDATYTAASSAYLGKNILNKPTTVVVKDGSGNIAGQASLEYDNYTSGIKSSGAVQHDAGFSTGYTLRGNLTAIQRWRNTDGIWLTIRNQYDDAGNVLSTADPLGNVTTFSYTDSWSDTHCTPSGGNAAAYRTKTTNALSQSVAAKYNSCTGTVASTTDPNSQTTTVTYDLMNRPLVTSYPDGGQTSICYSEVTGTTCYNGNNPPSVVTTTKLSSTANLVQTVVHDGLGRVKQTQLNSDPSGADSVDTTYDALGRVSTVSNPHRSGSNTTDGTTTTSYDTLGRITKATKQDGSTSTLSYSGNCVTTTDDAGKSRKNCSDGLGRLTGVWEDPSGVNYEADYKYDLLNNLLRVDQKGTAPTDGTKWRTRLFTYNSLSQLLTAFNPESGTISYSYDANGNVFQKTSPAPNQTGSTTQVITYCYDALNRITGKAYSAQTCTSGQLPAGTASATYIYDDPTVGWQLTNVIGRLVEDNTYDQPGGAQRSLNIYNYDPMGRIITFEQGCGGGDCTDPPSSFAVYTYDLAGDVTSLHTFEGTIYDITYNYTYNTAGQPTLLISSLSDAQHPGTLASGVTYYPTGAIQQISYGNGLTGTHVYNNRLQPCRANVNSSGATLQKCTDAASAGSMQDFSYSYNAGTNDNGNVAGITQYVPVVLNAAMFSQSGFASGDYWPGEIADGYTGCCGWQTDNEATGAWLQVDLGTAKPLIGIRVYASTPGYAGNWSIQYSDDASNWSTASSSFVPSQQGWNWQAWASVGAHRYWRLYLTNTPGRGAWLTELEFVSTSTRSYSYDSLNRLTGMNSPSDTCTGLTWSYDAWANRLSQTGTGGTCNSNSVTALANNQISGYSYDAAGNLTSDGVHTYTYDAENRIISVDAGVTARFVYDAQGRRVGKLTNDGEQWQNYLYGTHGEVLSESTLSRAGYGWPAAYAYFGGQLLAEYENSTTEFVHHDHLGSTRLMTQVDETIYDSMDYLPFGEQITGSWGSTHKFTGKERDSETGLDNFGARYYAGNAGRFMTPDPTGGHVEDPQTLNKYSYVRNLPTTLTDPTGLDFHLQCDRTIKTDTCQGGLVGTTTTDANGNKSFTATVISNDKNGNLVDQNGNAYSGQVDASGVHFAKNGSNTSSTGSWIRGSNATSFAQTSGALAGFSFAFSEPGKTQTLAGTFSYSSTRDEAKTALVKAGFSHSTIDQFLNPLHGFNVTHFRGGGDPRTGRGSAHFILYPDFVSDDGVVFDLPKVGDFHYGEVDPRIDFPTHFKQDVIPFITGGNKDDVPH